MKIFLSISGALAWIFGLALLFFPSNFYAPTGIAMTSLIATLAQAHGATLVGLGFINWFSRNISGENAIPVLAGNLVVQILSLGVVVWTISLVGFSVFPGVIIHITLGGFFAYFLYRNINKD